MAKELRFDFWQGQEIFLFSTAFRPALGPTQLAIQQGVKWQGCEADHSLPSCAKVKNGGAIKI
jgi:hypothetical protein